MHLSNIPVRRRAQGKPKWGVSEKGNRFLSYYRLKISIFSNERWGGWTVAISEGERSPRYVHFHSEEEAKAVAEQEFLLLKSSGKFDPVKIPLGPLCLPENVFNKDGALAGDYEDIFLDINTKLMRESAHADLHEFADGKKFWVPHSQGKIVKRLGDSCRLIAAKWWRDRAEPAR